MKAIYSDPKFLEKLATYAIYPELGKVFNHLGTEMTRLNHQGYVVVHVSFDNKTRLFKRSHAVWWKHRGTWPTFSIDHANRDRTDDRISNLLQKTIRENNANKFRASGLPTGVTKSMEQRATPYQAMIYTGRVPKFLGRYATIEEAANAYRKAKEEIERALI